MLETTKGNCAITKRDEGAQFLEKKLRHFCPADGLTPLSKAVVRWRTELLVAEVRDE